MKNTRWTFQRLILAWEWRVEQLFHLQCGGASIEDEKEVREDIDNLLVRAGWTEKEFDAHLTKRFERCCASMDRAERRS